jgi:hypothetical protein
VIPSGADVGFEKHINVPADARGPDMLRWEIIGEVPLGSASAAILLVNEVKRARTALSTGFS